MMTMRVTTRPPRGLGAVRTALLQRLFALFAPLAAVGNRTRSGVGVCRPVFWYLAVIARSLGCRRAALCRVRVQHGPEPDDGASPLLPHGGDRVARRMASDVRWRGPGLGGRARHHRRGPGLTGVLRALRREPA